MWLFFYPPIYGTWQSALYISFESALRLLSVKIIWQNMMLAMEQQKRFQGEGRQSRGLQAPMLVITVPFTLSVLLTAPLPSPNCAMLTRLSHIPMCFGHEVRRWRRGDRNGIAGLGEQGNAKQENRWEQQEAVGRPAASGDRQHLYPNLMSPRPVLALCSSLPCWCSLCLECPCHLERSDCPPRPSSKITYNPHTNQSCLYVPFCFHINFNVCVYVSFLVDCECLRSKCSFIHVRILRMCLA